VEAFSADRNPNLLFNDLYRIDSSDAAAAKLQSLVTIIDESHSLSGFGKSINTSEIHRVIALSCCSFAPCEPLSNPVTSSLSRNANRAAIAQLDSQRDSIFDEKF